MGSLVMKGWKPLFKATMVVYILRETHDQKMPSSEEQGRKAVISLSLTAMNITKVVQRGL